MKTPLGTGLDRPVRYGLGVGTPLGTHGRWRPREGDSVSRIPIGTGQASRTDPPP